MNDYQTIKLLTRPRDVRCHIDLIFTSCKYKALNMLSSFFNFKEEKVTNLNISSISHIFFMLI